MLTALESLCCDPPANRSISEAPLLCFPWEGEFLAQEDQAPGACGAAALRLEQASEPPGRLVKPLSPGSLPTVSAGGSWRSQVGPGNVHLCSQELLMLLVWKAHFENQCVGFRRLCAHFLF